MLYRMVALVLDGLVGFPAGLSPTCFHLSPSSFHLSPRRGLVSHILSCVSQFFSFVSHFFSFVSQAGCLWSGRLGACGRVSGWLVPGWLVSNLHVSPTSFHLSPRLFLVVGFRARLSPTCFHVSPNSFHLSRRLGACGRAGCLWSGSRLACLPFLFICLPVLFICLPGGVLVVGLPAGLSPTSFHFVGGVPVMF